MPPTKPKQAELRTAPLEWEENEDAVLHELVQDYSYNWTLIADLFNSSRITISTDERSPWDCYDRWNHKFGPASKEAEATGAITAGAEGAKSAIKTGTTPSAVPTPTAPTPSNGAPSASGEPQPPLSPGAQRRDAKAAKLAKFEGSKKKVRIMCLREAMRRIQKRRDLVNKKPANPRNVVNVHESHHPYLSDNRIQPTPQELSAIQHENLRLHQAQMEQLRNMENQRRMQAQQAQRQAQAQAGRMQLQMQQQAAQNSGAPTPQQAQQLQQVAQLQQAQQAQLAGRLQTQMSEPSQQPNGMPMTATNSQPGAPMQMQARPVVGAAGLPQNMTPQQQQQMVQVMMAQRGGAAAVAAMRNGQMQLPNGANRLPNGAQNQQASQAGSPAQNMMHAQQLPSGMQQQMAVARGAASPASSTQGTLQGSPQVPSGQVMHRPQSASSQHQQSQSPQTNGRAPMAPQATATMYAALLQQQQQQSNGQVTPEQRARQLQLFQQIQQQANLQQAMAQQNLPMQAQAQQQPGANAGQQQMGPQGQNGA